MSPISPYHVISSVSVQLCHQSHHTTWSAPCLSSYVTNLTIPRDQLRVCPALTTGSKPKHLGVVRNDWICSPSLARNWMFTFVLFNVIKQQNAFWNISEMVELKHENSGIISQLESNKKITDKLWNPNRIHFQWRSHVIPVSPVNKFVLWYLSHPWATLGPCQLVSGVSTPLKSAVFTWLQISTVEVIWSKVCDCESGGVGVGVGWVWGGWGWGGG